MAPATWPAPVPGSASRACGHAARWCAVRCTPAPRRRAASASRRRCPRTWRLRKRRCERAMVRVVVVDDEPMVCAHLRTILGSAADIEVVAEAHDGAAGVDAVVRERPDVVLMD